MFNKSKNSLYKQVDTSEKMKVAWNYVKMRLYPYFGIILLSTIVLAIILFVVLVFTFVPPVESGAYYNKLK